MPTVLYPSPVFGPVSSRRLGRSLGINLLPPDGKVCSFDCIYCECGLNAERRPRADLPSIALLASELEARLMAMRAAGEPLDAITFSGNGEPTSHPEFLQAVETVRALRDRFYPDAKVAVLTNATHLARPRVFEALKRVDRPCLKLDTVNPDYIRRIDRPTSHYDVNVVIERMAAFEGRAIVQTMFMRGTFEGESVDNTGDAFVVPWLAVLERIRPQGVDIYTIARETPVVGLQKVDFECMQAICRRVEALGISCHAYA